MTCCGVAGGDVCWFVGADSEKQILFTWSGGAVDPNDWDVTAEIIDRLGGSTRYSFSASVITTPKGAAISIPVTATETESFGWRSGFLRVTAKHTPTGDTYGVFSGRARVG